VGPGLWLHAEGLIVKLPLIVLVHGYNVTHPAIGIGRLREEFARHGFPVVRYDTGKLSLVDVRAGNPNLAAGLLSMVRMADMHGQESILVGHSNGCALIDLADQLQWEQHMPVFTRAAYISPALDRKTDTGLERVDVFHTKSDDTVLWSRLLAFHPWGDMGRAGYSGRNRSYINHDATSVVHGHSGWWTDEGMQYLRSALVNPLAQGYGLTGGTPDAPMGFQA